MKKHLHLKCRKSLLRMGLLATISLFWLLIKTGRKPSRIVYPCQRAAVANINIFLLALFAPLLDLRKLTASLPHVLNGRSVRAALAIGSLLIVSGLVTFPTGRLALSLNYLPVPLNLESQNATVYAGSSNLFVVSDASGSRGDMDSAISTLLWLMESHSLFFFKTASHPAGLIGKNDVVLIKVNAMGPERAGTNTDLVKSLIAKILNHPEGFTGEIVIADNGQTLGGLNLAESNAYDHSQSMQDVVNMFASHKVSAWYWHPIATKTVNEYSQGDFSNGYVVDPHENPTTHVRVSYPKFKTKYGTYISFKNGIWSTATNSYNKGRLKLINAPILKSHYNYGVTACVKNYQGVASQDLTNSHAKIPYGCLGTEIVGTRFPTLNILDAIWVNANPKESGSNCGPFTPYEVASYTNVIGASQDPVALEYWAAKHVLIPAAIRKGYTSYSSLNPDYAPITRGLTESYHNYLERSMNQLKNAGYQVTMTESAMNVYVTPARRYLFQDGFESGTFNAWSGASVTSGETAAVVSTRPYHGIYSARFTSNGGGYERACVYKTIATSPEVYARGYLYVAQSGIVENGDRFYFLSFKAGSNDVAYGGWRKTGGVTKWFLTIRDGTSYATVFSSGTPLLNRWYSVELHWKNAASGLGELWIDGTRVCSISGKNTAVYGNANIIRFGLPQITYCGPTTAYCDDCVISRTRIGPAS